MKNQKNITPPEEQNKALATNSNKMEVYKLSQTEFKITVLKKLIELKEITDKQIIVNEIMKTIHEQNKFNKETETIEKKQTNFGAEEYKV